MSDWVEKSIEAGGSFGDAIDSARARQQYNDALGDLYHENALLRQKLEQRNEFFISGSERISELSDEVSRLYKKVNALQSDVNFYKGKAGDYATHMLSGFLSDSIATVQQLSLGHAQPQMWDGRTLPLEKNEVAQRISQVINHAKDSTGVIRNALNEWIENHKHAIELKEIPDGDLSEQVKSLGEHYGIFKAVHMWLNSNPGKQFETPVEALNEALLDASFSKHLEAVETKFPVPVIEAGKRRFTMWKEGNSVRFGLLPDGYTSSGIDPASISENITDLMDAVGLKLDENGFIHGDGATPARLAALMESVSLRFSRKLFVYHKKLEQQAKEHVKALGFNDFPDELRDLDKEKAKKLFDVTGVVPPKWYDDLQNALIDMRDGMVNWFEQSAIRSWQTLVPESMVEVQKQQMFKPETRGFADQLKEFDKQTIREFTDRIFKKKDIISYRKKEEWMKKNIPHLFHQFAYKSFRLSTNDEGSIFQFSPTYEIDKDLIFDAMLFIAATSGNGNNESLSYLHNVIKNKGYPEFVHGDNSNRFWYGNFIEAVHSILNMPPMSSEAAISQAEALMRAADDQISGIYKPSMSLNEDVKNDMHRNSSEQTRVEEWAKAYAKATFLKGYGSFMSIARNEGATSDPKLHMLAMMAGLKAAHQFYYNYANDLKNVLDRIKDIMGPIGRENKTNRLLFESGYGTALRIARQRQSSEIINEVQKVLVKSGLTVGVKPAWVMGNTIDQWLENTISMNDELKKSLEQDIEHLTKGDKPVAQLNRRLTDHVRPVVSSGDALVENTMRARMAVSLENSLKAVNDEIDELKHGDNVTKAFRQAPLALYVATKGEQYPKSYLRNIRDNMEKDAFYEKALLMMDKHSDMRLIDELKEAYSKAFGVNVPDGLGVKETLDKMIDALDDSIDLSDKQKMQTFSRFTLLLTEFQAKLDRLREHSQISKVAMEMDAVRTQAPKPDASLVKKLFANTNNKIILGDIVGNVDHVAIFDRDNAYGLYKEKIKPFIEGEVVPASTLLSMNADIAGIRFSEMNHDSVAIHLEPHSAYTLMILGKQLDPDVDAFLHGDAREGIRKVLERQPDFMSKYIAVGQLAALTAMKMADASWLNQRAEQIERNDSIDEDEKAKLLDLISRMRIEGKLDDHHLESLGMRLKLLKEAFDRIVENATPEERKDIVNAFGGWDVNQYHFLNMVSLLGGADIAASSGEMSDHMYVMNEQLNSLFVSVNPDDYATRLGVSLPFGDKLGKDKKLFNNAKEHYKVLNRVNGHDRVKSGVKELDNHHSRRMLMFAWVASQIGNGSLKGMDAIAYIDALESGDEDTVNKALGVIENIQQTVKLDEKLIKQDNLTKLVKN